MFDYRFTRNADEYTARLRREAMQARLARSAASSLASGAARLFRAWANRLERGAANRPGPSTDGWFTGQDRYEAPSPRRPNPYASNGL